jgi:hypothetical protein
MGENNISTVGTTVHIKQQKSWGTEEVIIGENAYLKTKRCGEIAGREICLTEVNYMGDKKFLGRKKLSDAEGAALDLISNAAGRKLKQAEEQVKIDPKAAARFLEESKRITFLGEIAYANIRSRGTVNVAAASNPVPEKPLK